MNFIFWLVLKCIAGLSGPDSVSTCYYIMVLCSCLGKYYLQWYLQYQGTPKIVCRNAGRIFVAIHICTCLFVFAQLQLPRIQITVSLYINYFISVLALPQNKKIKKIILVHNQNRWCMCDVTGQTDASEAKQLCFL